CVFFFQAEDGIRAATVTGVQTCALPIFSARANDAIAANDVLSSLRPSSKQQLVAGVTFQELEKDTVICHQEAAAVRFWLVLRGEIGRASCRERVEGRGVRGRCTIRDEY